MDVLKQELRRSSEGSHWYSRDGSPMYEIMKADGSGMRSTTLRDARKLNLVPSVTTILKVLHSGGLERYKIEQAIMASLTLPMIENEKEEDYVRRIRIDMEEHAKTSREEGLEIHAALERFAVTGLYNHDVLSIIKPVCEWLKQEIKVFKETEYTFAHPSGFGGMIDLIGLTRENDIAVIDYKTTTTKPKEKMKPYPEAGLQLGAYMIGAPGFDPDNMKLISIIISRNEPGRFLVHPWLDPMELYRQFMRVFRLWMYLKGYDPAKGI